MTKLPLGIFKEVISVPIFPILVAKSYSLHQEIKEYPALEGTYLDKSISSPSLWVIDWIESPPQEANINVYV